MARLSAVLMLIVLSLVPVGPHADAQTSARNTAFLQLAKAIHATVNLCLAYGRVLRHDVLAAEQGTLSPIAANTVGRLTFNACAPAFESMASRYNTNDSQHEAKSVTLGTTLSPFQRVRDMAYQFGNAAEDYSTAGYVLVVNPGGWKDCLINLSPGDSHLATARYDEFRIRKDWHLPAA